MADITELPTDEGKLYLAVVLDACSRRVVGWSMAELQRTALVVDALEAALAARHPLGTIFHSDRGSQYTSLAFGDRLAEAGVAASMGAPGTAFDNAMAESFFASLETELIDRSHWATRAEARLGRLRLDRGPEPGFVARGTTPDGDGRAPAAAEVGTPHVARSPDSRKEPPGGPGSIIVYAVVAIAT